MVFLKLVAALFVLLGGIGAICAAGYAFLESNKPEVHGIEVVAYGVVWTVGLIGGIILCISGVFFATQAFV